MHWFLNGSDESCRIIYIYVYVYIFIFLFGFVNVCLASFSCTRKRSSWGRKMRGIARRAIGSRKWSSGWRCGRRPIFLLSTSNVSNKFVVVVIAIAIIVVVAVVIICIVVLRGGGEVGLKKDGHVELMNVIGKRGRLLNWSNMHFFKRVLPLVIRVIQECGLMAWFKVCNVLKQVGFRCCCVVSAAHATDDRQLTSER